MSVAVSPAFAEPAQRSIQYRDLDLTSVAGQDAFAARVDRAVAQVCWQGVAPGDVSSCRAATKEQLMAQLPHAAREALIAVERRGETSQLAER